MFHDVSTFFILYNMGEVCYNQIGTYGFEAKREKERFTAVCPRCRQNWPLYVVVLTSAGEKCTKMCVARAARSFLPLLTNNITAFWRWRCRCRSRRSFLNSLLPSITVRKGWGVNGLHPALSIHFANFLF